MTQHTANEQLLGWLLVVGLLLFVCYGRRKWRGSGTAYGTARWSSEPDLTAAQMLSDKGLILGRTARGLLIRMPRYVHLSVFAPTGAGKGVSFLIPWLLTYVGGSCVVIDPKGELYRATAARRRQLGYKVARLDPFGVCGPGADCWNPLDLIADGPNCVDEIRPLSEAMVIRPPEGDRDPHWGDQAANVITALLALIIMRLQDADRNLSSLRELVANPAALKEAEGMLRAMGGIFARLAGLLGQLEERERAGVLSTVARHTTFLDSLAIIAGTTTSTFNPRELLQGNMTLFLILPPHQMEAQSRWLRLVIGSLVRLIGREGVRNGKECLFLLDEAGQFGHMSALEQGLTLLRGYGLKMAFFFQSLSQLKEVFRDKEGVLLDNTEHIYFGTNSYETAERISKTLGNATITVESANTNSSESWQQGGSQSGGVNVSRSFGRNLQEKERALLHPDEILTMHGDYVIAFLRGLPGAVLAKRIKWYADPMLMAFAGGRRKGKSLLWWLSLLSCLGMVIWALLSRR